MAMEKKKADQLLLDLLAEAAASGLVTSSQMAKGFGRVSDAVEDLSLDVPDAREKLAALAGLATADGWLSESAGKQLDQELHSPVVNSDATRKFKAKAVALIQVGPGDFACVNAIMRMLPSSACKVGVFVEGWCSVRNEHSCLAQLWCQNAAWTGPTPSKAWIFRSTCTTFSSSGSEVLVYETFVQSCRNDALLSKFPTLTLKTQSLLSTSLSYSKLL